jgi:hypothetical protein
MVNEVGLELFHFSFRRKNQVFEILLFSTLPPVATFKLSTLEKECHCENLIIILNAQGSIIYEGSCKRYTI